MQGKGGMESLKGNVSEVEEGGKGEPVDGEAGEGW